MIFHISTTSGHDLCINEVKFCLDYNGRYLKATADFYQAGTFVLGNVEGERLENGDFTFYWDDFPNRKIVKTTNNGEFIKSGFLDCIWEDCKDWKDSSLWHHGKYDVREFQGADFTSKCRIDL